jgi:transaldolase
VTPTNALRDLGQSLWLDTITRDLLSSGLLREYRDDLQVSGLTSNPTIFASAITGSDAYDEQIARLVEWGYSDDALLFGLAIEDLSRASAIFAPIHRRTAGVDGWVSLEVSPLLAHDASDTVAEAVELWRQAHLPNLFIKIPGTPEGTTAIEEAVFRGVPINVTLLFSRSQYLASANAYLRGLERRIAAGLSPDVPSVASLFVSRWDKATAGRAPERLRNSLGIAIAQRTYRAYRDVLDSDRWQRLSGEGARPQRLLFASTGTKDPNASDVLYVTSLAAPNTITTMPQQTLLALEEHGRIDGVLRRDGGDCEHVISEFAEAGVDIDSLAEDLQEQGASSFTSSWQDLRASVNAKGRTIRRS